MSLETAVRNVRDFNSLLTLFRDELKWEELPTRLDTEEITFEWSAGDLNISDSAKTRLNGGVIRQLQPVPDQPNQPWGIFFVEFADKKIYRGALREVLRGLVPKQRRASHLPAWKSEDILFICATRDYEQFTFAHFRGQKAERAILSTFGWQRGDTHIRTLCDFNLLSLTWPDDESNKEAWRKKWNAAFDVEKVTDRFFVSYRDVFEKVEAEVKKSIKDHEHARLYTQRLFNRLMFIYFIQKKEWLTFDGDKDYLRKLFDATELNKENFLRNRLHWLFFYGMGNAGLIRDPQQQQFLESRRGVVPFLNGGLFDIEDDYDAKLSTEKKLEAADVAISNQAFSRILELFERYNFTIEESTPLDVQVAVDPEMLGKVFEELVTGRHETGSYYTPRPVVSFMCREALKHYLTKADANEEAVAAFVDEKDTSKLGDPETMLEALKRVRVCDPACGSGAYLLGMLQELMRLRGALFKDYTIDFDKLYDRKREIIERNLYGVDKDRFAVQIACLRLWLSLAIESDNPKPLPNLDFKIGCDDSLTAPPPQEAQPDMFRVEKVRSYQKKKAEFLKCNDPDRKRQLREEIEALRDEIAVALKHQPPTPNPQRVRLAQDRAAQLAKEIRELVRSNKKPEAAVKQAALKKLKRQLDLWEKATNGEAREIGFDWAVEFAEIFMPQTGETWRMDDLHPLLNDFKSQATLVEQPRTEEGGFDIVLANPPYVRADAQFKHIKNEKERQVAIAEWKIYRAALLKNKFYETLSGKWDLYLPFLERAYQLMREGGDMVFIISDAYNAAQYAKKSHEFFISQSLVERIDFCTEIPLFRAGVNNTILHFAKAPPNGSLPVRVRRWGETSDEFDGNAERLPSRRQREFGEALFKIDDQEAIASIEGFLTLGAICYVSYGLRANSDERYWRGEFVTEDLVSDIRDKKHPKRFIEGKDLVRWWIKRVRYLEWGTKRAPVKFSRPTFPELHGAKEKLIALVVTSVGPPVVYDANQTFTTHTSCIFVPWDRLKGIRNKSIRKTAKYRDEFKPKAARPLVFREQLEDYAKKFDPKYLLAIMNSRVARAWLATKRRSKIHVYPDDWKLLPIPPLSIEQQQEFVKLVDEILAEFETSGYPLSAEAALRVQELESEIDKRVGALYSEAPPSVEADTAASADAAIHPFA